MRYEAFLKGLTEDYMDQGIVSSDKYPDIRLYIDQVVQCLNDELAIYGNADKNPMTKAMVSNYAKLDMIPGPEGKRYTRDHLLFLTMVFYLKCCFSMEEIGRLMKPLVTNFESAWDEKIDLKGLYDQVACTIRQAETDLPERLTEQMGDIKKFLEGKEAGDDDTQEIFLLILTLIMRSNAERFLAKKLLDTYFAPPVKKAKK